MNLLEPQYNSIFKFKPSSIFIYCIIKEILKKMIIKYWFEDETQDEPRL